MDKGMGLCGVYGTLHDRDVTATRSVFAPGDERLAEVSSLPFPRQRRPSIADGEDQSASLAITLTPLNLPALWT